MSTYRYLDKVVAALRNLHDHAEGSLLWEVANLLEERQKTIEILHENQLAKPVHNSGRPCNPTNSPYIGKTDAGELRPNFGSPNKTQRLFQGIAGSSKPFELFDMLMALLALASLTVLAIMLHAI